VTMLKIENVKINMLFSIQAFSLCLTISKYWSNEAFHPSIIYPTCEAIYIDNNVVEEAFLAIIANRFLDMVVVVIIGDCLIASSYFKSTTIIYIF